MNVLSVHNRYREAGGEDGVFEAEAGLLDRHGHAVTRLVFDNDDIPEGRSAYETARLAAATIWSRTSAQRVADAVRKARPDVVHFHNTFPLISPSAYSACTRQGVAVVQTLHNYRLICPNAICFRDGHPCEDCVGQPIPWPGVVHACYRGSHAQSAVAATMLTVHRLAHTWQRHVHLFIALTYFARNRLVHGGISPSQIVVKPNFLVDDPGIAGDRESHFLFVGRLTEDKGVRMMLEAWSSMNDAPVLRIVGDGPLAGAVAHAAEQSPAIEFLGRLTHEAVLREMGTARALLFPSLWYEGFPLTIVEAFARGLPVIGGKLGAMQEIIEVGKTGLLFAPGHVGDMATTIEWARSHPYELSQMGRAARHEFERSYTEATNYAQLIAIYEQAMSRVGQRSR